MALVEPSPANIDEYSTLDGALTAIWVIVDCAPTRGDRKKALQALLARRRAAIVAGVVPALMRLLASPQHLKTDQRKDFATTVLKALTT